MLSRLSKKRAPSTSRDTPPPSDFTPSSSSDSHSHSSSADLPSSPTPSSTSSTRFSSPAKDERTLSPTRALNQNGTRANRSSSFGNLAPPNFANPADRRSVNLSAPGDPNGGVYVPNGHALNDSASSSLFSSSSSSAHIGIGDGSLSLDHLDDPTSTFNTTSGALGPDGKPLTLVVQAPELRYISNQNGNDGGSTGGTTPTAERALDLSSADMSTPVPSQHPDFGGQVGGDARGRGFSNPTIAGSSLSPSVPLLHPSSSSSSSSSRPRSHTTSEAFLSSRTSSSSSGGLSTTHHPGGANGLEALAALNGSSSHLSHPSSSRPHSPMRSATHSPTISRTVSSRASRSSSINSAQQPDHSSLRPPSYLSSVSPSRSRKTAARSVSAGGGGIAGALALSGVALASPNAGLRQPHGLVRISSDLGREKEPSSSAGTTGATGNSSATASSSLAQQQRESLEGAPSLSLPSSLHTGELDDDAISQDDGHGGSGGGGGGGSSAFLSMEQLGDFDDVVSQLGTGYAVASSKRNADFHALFKGITEDDYLIEDYGCALQREILIQGRLYISEHHLSFYANIFGWVTSLTIPFSEVCSIEKRMTAYVIPNAIQVATMHARHTFASFLSRDTTYDLIGNIWRMVHPVVPMSAGLPDAYDNRSNAGHSHIESDEEGDGNAEETGGGGASSTGVEQPQKAKRRLRGFRRPRGGTGESTKPASGSADASATNGGAGGNGANGSGGADGKSGDDRSREASGSGSATAAEKPHAPTSDTCDVLRGLKETCLDSVFPGRPEKIYNLMFTSGFMKDFWAENQKLLEIQISDWAPQASGTNLLARSMSYIKPLNGSIGPKQTKCLITDETAHVDFDDFITVVTTTRTPDVPSGSAFAVKTRTSLTWSRGNQCRVVVTTGVEWSKSSFIKGIIERSCIEGQKTYHSDLEQAMRAYIATHRNEFVAEGQSLDLEDAASLAPSSGADDDGHHRHPSPSDPSADASTSAGSSKHRQHKKKDHSAAGPLAPLWELLEPLFEQLAHQSPKTLLLGAVVVVLVLSNVWTLRSSSASSTRGGVGEGRRPGGVGLEKGNGNGAAGAEGHHDVAAAVRDVLQDYFAAAGHARASPSTSSSSVTASTPSSSNGASPTPSSSASSYTPPSTLDELRELEVMLDRIEERVRELRGGLRAARDEGEDLD